MGRRGDPNVIGSVSLINGRRPRTLQGSHHCPQGWGYLRRREKDRIRPPVEGYHKVR